MSGTHKTAHAALVAAGIEIDHHESDLYAKDSEQARLILHSFNLPWVTFRSQVDGLLWLDVPFAYTPYWEAKRKAAP